jgi:hypothetical protein
MDQYEHLSWDIESKQNATPYFDIPVMKMDQIGLHRRIFSSLKRYNQYQPSDTPQTHMTAGGKIPEPWFGIVCANLGSGIA